MDYGERLKEIIDESGLSPAEVARRIGVTPANISQLTAKSYPLLRKIELICKAIDKDVWEFFIDKKELSKIYNIPEEYLNLVKTIQEFEPQIRYELLELFERQIELLINYKQKEINQ